MMYTILEEDTLLDLKLKVNDFIKAGWVPQGGVSTGDTRGSYIVKYTFIQAMVKE